MRTEVDNNMKMGNMETEMATQKTEMANFKTKAGHLFMGCVRINMVLSGLLYKGFAAHRAGRLKATLPARQTQQFMALRAADEQADFSFLETLLILGKKPLPVRQRLPAFDKPLKTPSGQPERGLPRKAFQRKQHRGKPAGSLSNQLPKVLIFTKPYSCVLR